MGSGSVQRSVTVGSSLSRPRPNLFIVGAPKCGTTTLYHALRQHPEVFMSPVKEPRYWSSDLRASGLSFHCRHVRRHLFSLRGLSTLPRCWLARRRIAPAEWLGVPRLDDYLSLFAEADPERHRWLGEASPDSLWSEVAAERISAFEPAARIVVALREPVAYLASIHRETLSGVVGETEPSLRRALQLEPKRRVGREVPCSVRFPFTVFYRLQAEFDVQIERFLRVFDRSQLHFVLLEDLAADPVATVDALLGFLDLPRVARALDLRPRNVSGQSGLGDLTAAEVAELRLELRSSVDRLQVLTGLPVGERWGYGDPR